MALINYLRPDYPKLQRDDTGVRRVYAFRGPSATIIPLLPAIGSTWLDLYPVSDVSHNPVGVSSYSDAIVETYQIEQQTTAEKSDDQYPFFEIDQVQIEKPIKQHPAFINFAPADWTAVNAWELETDMSFKSGYQYYLRDKDNEPTGSLLTLTGSAASGQQCYARLRLLGVESFLDFAPVVRKTSRYLGSSAPDSSDAGQKEAAPTYAPTGYEWLKTADRVSKAGSKGTEWIRQEEWTGARKILLDKDEVFTT